MQLAEQLQQVFLSETLEHCRSWVSLLQILRFPWNRHITCQPRHGRRNASRQSVSDAASTQLPDKKLSFLQQRCPKGLPGRHAVLRQLQAPAAPCILPAPSRATAAVEVLGNGLALRPVRKGLGVKARQGTLQQQETFPPPPASVAGGPAGLATAAGYLPSGGRPEAAPLWSGLAPLENGGHSETPERVTSRPRVYTIYVYLHACARHIPIWADFSHFVNLTYLRSPITLQVT